MATWEVKRATPGDLEPLLRLQEAFCEEIGLCFDPDARRATVAQLLGQPELGGAWLAEADELAMGYVVLCHGFSLELGGRDAFVDELFVSPDFRGRGVARSLLERAVKDGGAAGARAFHLEVEEANPAARALYEKFGFQLRGYRLMTRRA